MSPKNPNGFSQRHPGLTKIIGATVITATCYVGYDAGNFTHAPGHLINTNAVESRDFGNVFGAPINDIRFAYQNANLIRQGIKLLL